jgi:hypothetical protein
LFNFTLFSALSPPDLFSCLLVLYLLLAHGVACELPTHTHTHTHSHTHTLTHTG